MLLSNAPFDVQSIISDTADGAVSVYAADMDGDLDSLSASYLDDKIAWHENTAWTAQTITTAVDGC